jgi:O-antigen/teichoic acid export membrane protein
MEQKLSRSLRQRLIAGSGANAFGQATTIGIQLFSLPLFLHYWNATTYGVWLILSAIPSYLSIADVGMVTTAANKMSIAMGQRDHAQANRVFQSALLFMLITCAFIWFLVVPAALWIPLPNISATPDARIAVAALGGSILVVLFSGLADALFKATGRYALGTFVGNLVRIAEWGGSMLGLVLIGSFTAVAVGGLLARLLGLFVLSAVASTGGHGIRWGVRDAKMEELRAMARPAFSFMLFPLTNALSFQGITLLVGQMLGPIAVALFNTYRTLARVAVQAISVFSYALWPEFSRLYGQGGPTAVLPLYRRTARSGAFASVLLSIFLYIAAPFLLRLWTHDAIGFEPVLMAVMLTYAAASSAAHIPRVFLLATNRHSRLAWWLLGVAIALLGLAALLGRRWGAVGVGAAMLISELSALLVCLRLTRRKQAVV